MPAALRGELKSMIVRHRFTITDAVMIGAVTVAALVAAWQLDIFPNETPVIHEHVFELDEIFAICALAFALFSWSRLQAQRREIRRRRAAEEEARALAYEDPLTGLPNRRQFEAALKAALAALPGADALHAVFMLDLNSFKRINDLYGHPVGDEALVQIAIRLRRAVRAEDMVARLGGDEFAVLARHLSGPEAATSLALRMIESLQAPVRAGGNGHRVGIGIGIALVPTDGIDSETLLRKADVALYRAKAENVSAMRFFEDAMDLHIRVRDRLQRDLRAAIDGHGEGGVLEVLYQPRLDLKGGAVTGFEAQPNWNHPEFGRLGAARIMPIAESAGLIARMTDAMLRAACADAASWGPGVVLSFAVIPTQLRDPGFGLRIITILADTGLSAARLEVEITESALVADLDLAQRVLGSLRDAGLRIALNDFGTGYSSLYHLRNFRVDTVKIDRSLIQAMTDDPESATIVRALVGLGAGLGLTVTAEGVQDNYQRAVLAEEGCQQAQGYLFSTQLTAQGATNLLANSPTRVVGA